MTLGPFSVDPGRCSPWVIINGKWPCKDMAHEQQKIKQHGAWAVEDTTSMTPMIEHLPCFFFKFNLHISPNVLYYLYFID